MKMKVAVVQAAPFMFDKAQTLEKANQLALEASKQGARLILFPEAFIPAYPRSMNFGTVVGSRTESGRETWRSYWENSVDLKGPDFEILSNMAKKAKAHIVMGAIEREGGTLYCSMLYFDDQGRFLGSHRKLKPTAAERVVWGEGDGTSLQTYQTYFGRIGGLICWENYMPLARTALYQQGIDIYLAPTADNRDNWQHTMKHIALESRCYVLSCNQFIHRDMYPKDVVKTEKLDLPEIVSRGGSTIISPLGEVLEGPVYDREEILYSELDLEKIVESRLDFDVVGHYARPDVFDLKVKGKS